MNTVSQAANAITRCRTNRWNRPSALVASLPPSRSLSDRPDGNVGNDEIRMTNDEAIRVDSGRLSLCKGEGRVTVEHRVIVWPEPLTSILFPSAKGQADRSTVREDVICRFSPSAMSVF